MYAPKSLVLPTAVGEHGPVAPPGFANAKSLEQQTLIALTSVIGHQKSLCDQQKGYTCLFH